MASERVLRWLWLGTVPYRTAWSLQQRLALARAAGQVDDAVLMLEHPPVFTMGRNGEPGHVPRGSESLVAAGAEYLEVDRGGSVTFHGPGQLVAYPVVRLASVFPLAAQASQGDVLRYVRALEQAVIATVRSHGVRAGLRPPYTGVWSGTEKLAAVGVKLARGVTMHGLALNVRTDLRWFEHIVPCGIPDAGVCSMETLGAAGVTPEALASELAASLARTFDARLEGPEARLAALCRDGLQEPAPAAA